MMTSPERLRKDARIPGALREALRELPNADPSTAQLEQVRARLGLAKGGGLASATPVLVRATLGRQLARKVRRIAPIFGFWPVAAAATLFAGAGAVFTLQHGATPKPTEVAPRASSAPSARTASRSMPLSESHVAVNQPNAVPSVSAVPAASTASAAPAVSVARSVARSAVVAAAPASDPVLAPAVSSAVPSAAFAPTNATTQSSPSKSGSAELALVQSANAALKSDPAKALRLAAEHRQLFPAGNLTQERDVIAIKALVLLGHTEQARRSLTAFELAYPHSAHTLELRQMLP